MSMSRALGQTSQPPNALEATWKDPVAEKQAAKRRKNVYGRMLPVAASPKKVRYSFYISIYIYLSIPLYKKYIHIYIYVYIYIYIYLSLSLSF